MNAMLSSWGRYPDAPQHAHAVSWRDALPLVLQQLRDAHGTTLAHGNGRSYGDSCLAASDHVLHLRTLDRMIDADWSSGRLRAEAGVTLAEVLRIAVPRGWMLPVTPGTQYATLGGAVANDVHGKNHHVRGTFGRHVTRFGLLRSDCVELECSPTRHAPLFNATIGGLGLTGIITWVEIRLMRIASSMIDVTSVRFDNLDGFFALSDKLDPLHEYSVAWVDCLAHGATLGRGLFMAGDHASSGTKQIGEPKKLSVPFTPPFSPVNRFTLAAFNALYRSRQRTRLVHCQRSYDAFFYPLDSLLHWNRLYGRSGFQQYQCVIPPAASPDALRAMLGAIARTGTGSFLAVLKRCGPLRSPGLLSFPLEGTSLALDFPQRERTNRKLFATLDAIVHEAGGRLYPAKDAHMSGANFRLAYPAWHEVEALRDPALTSRFWQRVTHT